MPARAPAVAAINTKVPPLDDVRVRQALVMAIDRKKLSQALTNGLAQPASNPYGEGSWVKCKDDGALPTDPKKAAELIKEYGKPVQFKMLFTATPRGRANAQVIQQFWKQIGADMEIEQVDQATFPPRAFQRKFDIIGWRIVDFPEPDDADVRQLPQQEPGEPRQLLQPRARQAARATPASRRTRPSAPRPTVRSAACINKEATWIWSFQNTYYAMAKTKVKGVPSCTAASSTSRTRGWSRRTLGLVTDLGRWCVHRTGGCSICCRSCSPSRCSPS